MQESIWTWSTSCGLIVYCYFHVFRLTNKGNGYYSLTYFLFNYLDFIRYGNSVTYLIDVSK